MAWTSRDALRPFLFVCRLFAWLSAVIVMGITAWAVTKRDPDSYRVIYPLVIVRLPRLDYEKQGVLTLAGCSNNSVLHSCDDSVDYET